MTRSPEPSSQTFVGNLCRSSIFSLVTECGRPIAALLPDELRMPQLRAVYSLLPSRACLDPELATRWQLWAVACDPDWASAQKRRIPMLPPKETLRLAFL